MEPTTETEKIFFKDELVTVTQARFISNGKTFAMRNISSVSIHRIEAKVLLAIFFIMVGLLAAVVSLIVACFIVIPSIIWIIANKDQYSVRINSNSGDTDGLISPDKVYITTIVNAINEAIIYRG